jgi:hypothetical protein
MGLEVQNIYEEITKHQVVEQDIHSENQAKLIEWDKQNLWLVDEVVALAEIKIHEEDTEVMLEINLVYRVEDMAIN